MSTPTKKDMKEEPPTADAVSSQQPEEDMYPSHKEGSGSPGAQHSSTTDDEGSLKVSKEDAAIGQPVQKSESDSTQGTEQEQGLDWVLDTVQPLPSSPAVTGTGIPVENGPGAYNVGSENPNSGRDLEAGRNDDNAMQEQEQEQPQSPACEHVVEAVKVEDDHVQRQRLEQEIRNSILSGAVQADVLLIPDDATGEENETDWERPTKESKVLMYSLGALVLLLALGLGLGLGLSSSNDQKKQAEPSVDKVNATMFSARPALEVVKERGFVRCGTNDLAFASMVNGQLEGLNVEQCRAMALLALGDPDKYELVWATSQNRFELLASGDFDMLAEGTTHTMGRDVFEDYTKAKFTFTTPYFYSGLVFGGVPAYVDCADRAEDFEGDCRKLKICVGAQTTHLEILSEILGGGTLVPYSTVEELVESYRSGSCNVIASEPLFLTKLQADYFSSDSEEFQGWTLGAKAFSKEPLALVTRQGDPEWSAMADISVIALYLAEAHNITKDNAGDMADLVMSRQGHQASEDFISSLVSLISEFGNYADLYQRHVEDKVPRQQGLNTVYDRHQSSGLLYSIPFGNIAEVGPDPIVNGTLEVILERGRLVCGIMPSRGPGFALFDAETDSWTGIDVEFCNAVAAALFAGDASKIVFVELQSMALSYMALATGTVDLVAGARVTMEASLREPSTGVGYKFSSPYYYDNDSRDAFAFMTRNNQLQWNDFVYWIVIGTIFAEEEGITAESSAEMPIVSLFGQHLKQMFRDAISTVGNYAELYNATLGHVIPREGANMLNEGLAGPQLFPISIN